MNDGSSPLARGGLFTLLEDDSDAGLIPAGAGRTGRGRCPGSRGSAHPRWRGEDARRRRRGRPRRGSSPLARGGPSEIGGVGPVEGLIPAGAGRTILSLEAIA